MTQNNFPMIDLCATGKRIKEVREQKGITVKALQAFLGFNEPVSIYKWQRGECLPTFDNMYAMACLFGVGIDDLLVGNRQEVVFVCAPWRALSAMLESNEFGRKKRYEKYRGCYI